MILAGPLSDDALVEKTEDWFAQKNDGSTLGAGHTEAGLYSGDATCSSRSSSAGIPRALGGQ
ncbi:MAG: hypothetical protein ABJA93_02205 [Sporichthyaceae bacterium]